VRRRQTGQYLKSAVLMGLLAVAIACPWYIKNVLNTGNPVYPFFYSVLGGKNWSAPQAAEYTTEQQSFGVGTQAGHHDITQIGHAILGLAYQPGRYINPAARFGGGVPLGSIGVVLLCAMMAWALSGKSKGFELVNLAAVGVSLFLWFYLSQQSRYIVTLAIPLSILLGGAVVRLRAGPILAGIAALQALYSIGLQFGYRTKDQISVALGMQSAAEYLSPKVGFYDAAQYINMNVPKTGRVALYDEVFGDFLDVPYYWANPGHSNEIPYDNMRDGHDYAVAMRKMGFTHVYANMSPSIRTPEDTQAWVAAMGLNGQPPVPFSPEMQAKYNLGSFEQRFVPLITDAVLRGELRPVQAFKGGGVLFEFTPSG
jgi:hypothetical protein